MADVLTPGPMPTPAQAQCPTCKQTFSGVWLFDRHRNHGACRDPRMMSGIHRDARGVWRAERRDGRFPVRQRATDGLDTPDAYTAMQEP